MDNGGFIRPEIVPTADGSQTLRHPVMGETYHSVNGAVAESRHVFISNGFDLCAKDEVAILEVGFGSGLNALLTLNAAREQGRRVRYTAVELYPMSPETAAAMTYAADPAFMALHASEWGAPQEITHGFSLHKVAADLTEVQFATIFDVVYFDAFAPDCQPQLWTREVFAKLHKAMSPDGALVTYSAKGDVKRALREAGFEVRRLPGAPGKRHMLRAVKSAL
ncbi:tRNA (5-methylaminomethyl-2-thiouridine)(34)-methyltransferase MnmD [Alistipes sp. OttesenSCG-928-B03]|nr:tRNA (5-methylaminomethyl-2-thiouridine)(34)-methyltransferase MnmD [Alistipes sp. OttesenSCG-928-B03]